MLILLFFQQIIASGTHVIAKLITAEIPSPVVLFYRGEFAALGYGILIALNRKRLKVIEKKDLITLFILGAINIPINQFIFLKSITYTTAPNVALAYAMSPVFVFILAAIFYGERSSTLKMFGLITAFAGVLLVLLERGLDLSSEYFLGNVLALAASVSWAVYTVLGKNFSIKYGAIFASSLTGIAGFFLYIPIFMLLPESSNIPELSTENWLQIGYLGIVTSIFSYVIWYYALRILDASKVSVFNNLQPILTTVLSVIFLSQDVSAILIIGGLITITGVIMTQKG
jgi:RarD protein